MRTEKCQVSVAEALSAIAGLSRADLIAHWEAVYGRPPPKGISRRLLEYSAAYALQVKAHGGLKPARRRELTRPVGPDVTESVSRTPPAAKQTLSQGARLVREWHGRTHTVDVADDGFLYDGRCFGSLSEIARAITGARWSGPRFFGL